MSDHPQLSETARRGLRALHRAVRREVEKKSKLGQYVIVFRDGKTVRILASEALKTEPPLETDPTLEKNSDSKES